MVKSTLQKTINRKGREGREANKAWRIEGPHSNRVLSSIIVHVRKQFSYFASLASFAVNLYRARMTQSLSKCHSGQRRKILRENVKNVLFGYWLFSATWNRLLFVIHKHDGTPGKSLNKALIAWHSVYKSVTIYCFITSYLFWCKNVRFNVNTVLAGVAGPFRHLVHKDIHRACGYLYERDQQFSMPLKFSTMPPYLCAAEKRQKASYGYRSPGRRHLRKQPVRQ